MAEEDLIVRLRAEADTAAMKRAVAEFEKFQQQARAAGLSERADIELLYSGFKDRLDRVFQDVYGSAPWDQASALARVRAKLEQHPKFDRTRYEELVLRAEREAR